MGFAKATKQQAKGRVCLIGVTGSGKTWTGLMWARALAGEGGRVAVIDTENGSASKYADEYGFDTMVLTSFTPKSYVAAIREAEAEKYDVVMVDSLSHAWMGKDGVLAMVDQATSRGRSGNAFTTGWREVTPEHNALVDALVQCKAHLICTMRAKTEYVIEENGGKKIPRKIGMAPVQRDGLEYEFDLVADMDTEHKFVVSKSRCRALDKFVANEPGPEVAAKFKGWLMDGTAAQSDPDPEVAPSVFADDDAFIQAVNDVLGARGFTPDEIRAAVVGIAKANKRASIIGISIADREKIVDGMAAGKADKYKADAKAVKAGGMSKPITKIIDFDDRDQKREFIRKAGVLTGKWEISAERYKSRRSLRANRYYWACVVTSLRDFMRGHGHYFTPEECHEFILQSVASRPVIDPKTGALLATIGRRSSKMNTEQFAEFVDAAINMLNDRWGVIVPQPETYSMAS